MHALTLLDIVVLIAVGGGALLGAVRGFVFEVLSLFAWVAVVIALKTLYTPATIILSAYLSTKTGASLLAFVVVGGIVYVGGRLIAKRIAARTRQSILGPVDRVLGLGFGAVKGLIGVTLLFMLGNLVFDLVYGGQAARPEWVSNARSYPMLQASRRAIDDLVQHRLHQGGTHAADGNASETGPADDATANSTRRAHRPIGG